MRSGRIGLTAAVVLVVANVLVAQTPPSFNPPPDLAAGFDPKILGAPPPPVNPLPPEAPVQAALAAEPKFWSGGAELGLSGSTGNTDLFKIRTGLNAKRATDRNTFTADFLYGLTRQAGRLSENKALLLLRDEITIKNSRWSVFVADTVEYDQFRAFNFREALHAGLSLQWFDRNAPVMLKTRFGAGVSYDLNTKTRNDRLVPEGMFGYDLDVKLTDRQKVVSTFDYYPGFSNWGRYRLRLRAAYEILLDPAYGLVLRLGVQDRYDSSPGGRNTRRNDLDYFSALMLRF